MGLIARLRGAAPTAAIFVLHGVVEAYVDEDIQINQLRLDELDVFLDALTQAFEVVELPTIVAPLLRGDDPPPGTAALTFDDGYRNNLTLVEPLLRSRGLPFAVFVTTDFIDSAEPMPTFVMRAALKLTTRPAFVVPDGPALPLHDEGARAAAIAHLRTDLKVSPQARVREVVAALRDLLTDDEWSHANALFESEAPLTWSELRHLADRGVTVGSHCHDHAVLHGRQPPEEVRWQLQQSRRLLERQLGRTCEHFAYPNGTVRDISGNAVLAVSQAGYVSASTNIPGRVKRTVPALFLPRIYVTREVARSGAVPDLRRLDRSYERARKDVFGE